MANGVDPDQTAPRGAVCSGSTLFASILNLSVMLGNYLQQMTFSDAFFSWRFKGQLLAGQSLLLLSAPVVCSCKNAFENLCCIYM